MLQKIITMKNQHNYFPEEKRFNNRISSLLIIIAFLMTSMVTYAVPAKAKFTGEWTLNSAKSSIAEYGEMISSRELKIDQKQANKFYKKGLSFLITQKIIWRHTHGGVKGFIKIGW